MAKQLSNRLSLFAPDIFGYDRMLQYRMNDVKKCNLRIIATGIIWQNVFNVMKSRSKIALTKKCCNCICCLAPWYVLPLQLFVFVNNSSSRKTSKSGYDIYPLHYAVISWAAFNIEWKLFYSLSWNGWIPISRLKEVSTISIIQINYIRHGIWLYLRHSFNQWWQESFKEHKHKLINIFATVAWPGR